MPWAWPLLPLLLPELALLPELVVVLASPELVLVLASPELVELALVALVVPPAEVVEVELDALVVVMVV